MRTEEMKTLESRRESGVFPKRPVSIVKGEGARLWDAEGREYIDLCAGFGVTALGHSNKTQRAVFERSFSDESAIIHGMGDVYPSVDKILLLEYLGQCYTVSASAVRNFTFESTGDAGTEVMLRVGLKNLGEFGSGS